LIILSKQFLGSLPKSHSYIPSAKSHIHTPQFRSFMQRIRQSPRFIETFCNSLIKNAVFWVVTPCGAC
jgi:hypothetical protein